MKDQEEDDFSDMKSKYQKLVNDAAESDSTAKQGEKKIEKLKEALLAKKEDDKEVEENMNLAKKAPGASLKNMGAYTEATQQMIDYQDTIFDKQNEYAADHVHTEPKKRSPEEAMEKIAAKEEAHLDKEVTTPEDVAASKKKSHKSKKSLAKKKKAKKTEKKSDEKDEDLPKSIEEAQQRMQDDFNSMQNQTQTSVNEFVAA